MIITQPNLKFQLAPSIYLRDIPLGTVFRHGAVENICLKTPLGVVDLRNPKLAWTEPHALFVDYQACTDVELIVRDRRLS